MANLPPCGLYRTGRALGDSVPAGRLVYFHNHGEPGAGVYLPSAWVQNRASFHDGGIPIPDPEWAASLEPLVPEGFYRVTRSFTCCEKDCQTFETDAMVQVGYDGNGSPILFQPQWTAKGLSIPERGSALALDRLSRLTPLKVAGTEAGQDRQLH